jgi:Mg-chelatase subunit ChlD
MGLIAQGPLFATSVAPPNIMLLFDDSGSMRISAGSVSRMTAAKQAAINLLDGLHNVRVGIASFGHPS